jgi:hypothetical protein
MTQSEIAVFGRCGRIPVGRLVGPPLYERGSMHNRCREDELVEGRHGGQL